MAESDALAEFIKSQKKKPSAPQPAAFDEMSLSREGFRALQDLKVQGTERDQTMRLMAQNIDKLAMNMHGWPP